MPVINPGDSIQAAVNANPTSTSFCLATGLHEFGSGKPNTASIVPKSGNIFTGQYGAILDGTAWTSSDVDDAAFKGLSGAAVDVSIRNLTVRNMPQNGVKVTDGAGATGWLVEYCDIHHCVRTGVAVAKSALVRHNRIRSNAYGNYSAFRGDNAIFEYNEISYGGNEQKIVDAANVIFRHNWVHHNTGNGGIWYDAAKAGILVEYNTVEDNDGEGIFIEQSPTDVGTGTSSSNLIRYNTIQRNAVSGVFISVSHYIEVYGNTLTDNFRGVNYFLDVVRIVPGVDDLMHVYTHDNIITVPGGGGTSGAWGASLSFLGSSPTIDPYVNLTKFLTFDNNQYVVYVPSNAYWYWGTSPAKTFAQWQAIPQDAGGSVSAR